jgi:hypothetical protein
MAIDPALVQRISGETGFQADVVEQILVLKSILQKISNDPVLSSHFVLIGGTAINLFTKEISRLSVDIDLDYVRRGTKPFDPNTIDKHFDTLGRIALSLGMKVYDGRSPNVKGSEKLRIMIEYNSNFSRDTGTLKLDISYLMKTTIYKPRRTRMRQLHPDDSFRALSFTVAESSELWAGKALALVYKSDKDPRKDEVSDLYSMQIARHLFDVSGYQQRIEHKRLSVDNAALRKAFIVKGVARIPELFLLTGGGMRHCTEVEIQKELDPYLKQRSDGKGLADRPTLQQMKKCAREFLNLVCSNAWTKREKQFVEEFQEKGIYKPELLFSKESQEFTRLQNNDFLLKTAEGYHKKAS